MDYLADGGRSLAARPPLVRRWPGATAARLPGVAQPACPACLILVKTTASVESPLRQRRGRVGAGATLRITRLGLAALVPRPPRHAERVDWKRAVGGGHSPDGGSRLLRGQAEAGENGGDHTAALRRTREAAAGRDAQFAPDQRQDGALIAAEHELEIVKEMAESVGQAGRLPG